MTKQESITIKKVDVSGLGKCLDCNNKTRFSMQVDFVINGANITTRCPRCGFTWQIWNKSETLEKDDSFCCKSRLSIG